MAFSRNSMIAAIAGSVSLAILTGCPQTPTTPGPVGSPSTTPTGSVAPTTTPSGSVAPTTTPSGDPSASPSVIPSSSPLVPTTVNGTVYDEEGAPVTAAKVRIESLNPSNPFDSTVDVTNGAYVANQVPAGVQVRITAFRENWTSRSRVTTLLPIGEGRRNEVNFGGATDTEDPSGPAYFISDYPEVAAVEPADSAENVNPASVSVRLTLSEPLDATNQRRFADAIRVIPGEAAADPTAVASGATTTDFLLEANQATGLPALGDANIFEISDDSTFLGDEDTKASVSWDSTGTIATLTFNAPLLADEDDSLRYVVALEANSSGEEIEDRQGNNLGSGTANLDGDYVANGLIAWAFKEPSLAIDSSALSSDDSRWRATHEHFTEFEVAEDDTDPTLTGVTVTTPTVNGTQITRISLTFSESMAAFGGGSRATLGSINGVRQVVGDTLDATEAAAFTFAVGETAADLDDVTLDGDSPNVVAGGTTNYGSSSAQRETEFRLTSPTLGVNPDDPKTLRLEVNGVLFADAVNAIKARVEGLSDPAGNSITEANADANEKVGNI